MCLAVSFPFFVVNFFAVLEFFCNFAPEPIQIHTAMAKIRSASNPVRTGGQGDTTYYVRNGEQITRSRRNNSNYGSTARRSALQQEVRTRWANVVNFYKECRTWMPKAFENKKRYQSDYNAFMQLNQSTSPYYLTKSQAEAGCSIPFTYAVSRGSLPPISVTWTPSVEEFFTDIKITIGIEANLTLGDLSENIIANNPTMLEGDNIAFVILRYLRDSIGYVYTHTYYMELTLDSSDTRILGQQELGRYLSRYLETYLSVSAAAGSGWTMCGCAVIHARRSQGLKVSNQSIVLVDQIDWSDWSSSAQRQLAVESYGVDTEALLEPGD